MAMTGTWADTAKVETLKALWLEGLSASQIAERLGGVSRNAVISKIHRLGLAGRVYPHRTITNRRARVSPVANAVAVRDTLPKGRGSGVAPVWTALEMAGDFGKPAVPPFQTPLAERKSLAQLEPHDCRFPFGDGPFEFCGRKKVVGLSYCADHARDCHVHSAPRPVNLSAGWNFGALGKVDSQSQQTPATAQPREKEEA